MPDSPGEGKVFLNARIMLVETGENQQVAFWATPHVHANGKTIYLENIEYGEGEEISPELTTALIDEPSEILNLSNFDLEGMNLRVKQLEVAKGRLILQAEAEVEKIPTAEN